jgi:hypothetical protein
MYCFYQAPNLATIVSGPILIAIALRGSFVIEKQVIKVKQQIPVIITLFHFLLPRLFVICAYCKEQRLVKGLIDVPVCFLPRRCLLFGQYIPQFCVGVVVDC